MIMFSSLFDLKKYICIIRITIQLDKQAVFVNYSLIFCHSPCLQLICEISNPIIRKLK